MNAPSRRGLLVAVPAAVLLLGASPAVPEVDHPDCELEQLCAEYITALDAYDAEGGGIEPERCPLWHTIQEIEAQLDALPEACTLAGVLAQARVAQRLARQPDGSLRYCESYTGNWPSLVIEDLLRLADGVVL